MLGTSKGQVHWRQ